MNRRKRRGSNAIEFALIAPVLILMLSGIIDYSWFFFTQQTIASAALDGARAGALTPFTDSPSSVVSTSVGDALTYAGVDGSYTVVTTYSGTQPDVTLTVDVQVEHVGLFGFVPLPDSASSSVTLRMEDQSETSET